MLTEHRGRRASELGLGAISLALGRGDGTSDRGVEAPIERPKFRNANPLVPLQRESDERIDQIMEVANDLIDDATPSWQIATVSGGRSAIGALQGNFRPLVELLGTQHLDQLIDEDGNAVLELGRGG